MNQAINFYHSTVVPDNTITSCVCLKSSEKENELLFTYRNVAQRLTINTENEDFDTKETGKFYTGAKIIWCGFQENILATLDDQFRFTLSSNQKSFEKIAEIKLSQKGNEEYNVITYTPSMQYVFLSSKFSDHCIILSFLKGQTPTLQIKVFDDARVIDSTRSTAAHHFLVLVQNVETGGKEVYTISAKTMEITSRKECSSDTISIFDFNAKKSKYIALLEADKIIVHGKKNEISLKSNVEVFSNAFRALILIQTEDRRVNLIDLSDGKTMLSFEAHMMFKKLFIISTKVALGVFENGDNVLFKIDPSSEKNLTFTQNINQLDLESPLTVKTSLFHKSHLYVGDPRSTFTYKVNESTADDRAKAYEMEDPKRLFCTNSDVCCLSNDTKTEIVDGELPKNSGPLINMFSLDEENENIAAVYQSVILFSNMKQKIAQHGIICADYHKNIIAYCHSRNTIQILITTQAMKKGGHKVLPMNDQDSITCIFLSDTYFAIGIYNAESETGEVRLLNHSFEQKSVFNLPSKPTSLIITNEETKLFAGMVNGAIIQLGIDAENNAFNNRISYIYFGTPGVDFRFITNPMDQDSFFFLDKKIYYYSNEILKETTFSHVTAFNAFVDDVENLFLVIADKGKIKEVNFEVENAAQQTFFIVENTPENPIQMCSCGDYCFSLSLKKDTFEIIAINKDSNVIAKIEHEGTPTNIVASLSDKENQINIIVSQDDPSIIYAFSFIPEMKQVEAEEDEDEERVEKGELTFLFEQKIDDKITSFASYGKKILFAFNNVLATGMFTDTRIMWCYGRCSFEKEIQRIVVHKNRIWCCCEGEGINVVTYNERDDRFEGVGVFPYKEKITALTPIDDTLAAFSAQNGEINFIKLDARLIIGLDVHQKIPDISFVSRVNVHGHVSLLFTSKKCIYYLMDNGILGAFIPSALNTEFRRAMRFQFKASSLFSETLGFFNPGKSLIAQKGLVDIDFIENFNSYEIEYEDESSTEIFASLSLLRKKIVL